MGFLIKFSNKIDEEIDVYLKNAVDYIIEGKLIAFPTNSVYGIGGNPQNQELIQRLYDIKFRDRSKGFLLLVSDYEEARKIAEFNEVGEKLAKHFWPGQLTLILKKRDTDLVHPEVSAHQDTIGIRVPENKIILQILNLLKMRGHFGGIIGTSANYSGEPPSIDGAQVARSFLGAIDLILDSGKSKSKIPTTIVDCSGNEVNFLRIGKITEEEVQKILSSEEI